ncbi:MAG: histidinol dehydrogenase [Thermodesulfobacteriota bacterium]
MISLVRADSEEGRQRLRALGTRQINFAKDHELAVAGILEEVRAGGDKALIKYIRQFDAPDLKKSSLRVKAAEFKNAYRRVDKDFYATLSKAIRQIEDFHSRQREQSWIVTRENGAMVGQLVRPVDIAGLYVPGGKGGGTPLISSVLMNAVPARIAGVPRIVLTTPPSPRGEVNPYLLVAAQEVGIEEVYKAGSAWGIAALAFGTQTVPKVDMIVGPGNVYVTLAKKLLSGMVGIDMIAGPSEVLVIADDTARAEIVAADLLSQAEHDALATAVLLTPSVKLAHAVIAFLKKQIKQLVRHETAGASLEQNGVIFVVNDIAEAVRMANEIAPEHLELIVQEPFAWLGEIRHAGAVFIGEFSPEPMGDYIAGPNHVLPTMGTARFATALGVQHFLKRTSLIYYTEKGFVQDAGDVIRMAEREGLTAHARAVSIRLKR